MKEIFTFLTIYSAVPAIAAPIAAIAGILVEQRRAKVFILAFQYTMVAWLLLAILPLESTIAKLIAGWIAAFILYYGAARASAGAYTESSVVGYPRGQIFRIVAILLVVIGTLGVSFEAWIPIETPNAWFQQTAALLIVLGILGVGLYNSPLQVGISLITIVSGFELVYSAVEPSLAVIALLALVHLGIAFVISYFEIIQVEEPSEAFSG
jgi:hypothetical protein